MFLAEDLAVASCAGDGQLWDVSDPGNPTMSNGEPHTHIKSPSAADQFEFIHSGIVSWDGKTFAIMDETGGGVEAQCNGAASQDGFYYFYDVVEPGAPAPGLRGRFTIPRAQSSEICVSHNANVIPIKGRKLMTAAYYQGGNTVIDFTDLSNVREVGFADLEDATGKADSWSTYWYNGKIVVNGGLNRRGPSGNRGVDVFKLTGSLGASRRTRRRGRTPTRRRRRPGRRRDRRLNRPDRGPRALRRPRPVRFGQYVPTRHRRAGAPPTAACSLTRGQTPPRASKFCLGT